MPNTEKKLTTTLIITIINTINTTITNITITITLYTTIITTTPPEARLTLTQCQVLHPSPGKGDMLWPSVSFQGLCPSTQARLLQSVHLFLILASRGAEPSLKSPRQCVNTGDGNSEKIHPQNGVHHQTLLGGFEWWKRTGCLHQARLGLLRALLGLCETCLWVHTHGRALCVWETQRVCAHPYHVRPDKLCAEG